ATALPNVGYADVSTLEQGTHYTFQVVAWQQDEEPGTSGTVDATTTYTPTIPGSLSMNEVSSTQLSLSWFVAKNTEKYRIYRDSGSGWGNGPYDEVPAGIENSFQSWQDPDANLNASSHTYKYKVSGYNPDGDEESAPSNALTSLPPVANLNADCNGQIHNAN